MSINDALKETLVAANAKIASQQADLAKATASAVDQSGVDAINTTRAVVGLPAVSPDGSTVAAPETPPGA